MRKNGEEKEALIAVIVPVYNAEQYLSTCVKSIMQQTYKNLEIILIDDGSTDSSYYICTQMLELDSRIKVLHKENGGPISAKKLGLESTEAEYIMFVDADDWINKDCCKKAYDAITSNNNLEIVCWSYYKTYINVEEKNVIFNDTQLIDCNNTNVNYYDMKIIGNTWAKLYNKQVLKDEWFNENLSNGEDVEFNFRIFSKVKCILALNEFLYHYRIREDSSVRKYSEEAINEYTKTITYMKQDIKEQNKLQINAYYSFGAVAFLMICMNMIFTKEYGKSYFSKVKATKELSKKEPYKDILKNSKHVKLPFTRKLPLLFAKYHMYLLLNIMIKVKKRIDE